MIDKINNPKISQKKIFEERDNLWWPPNKGILYQGSQKATKEKLLEEINKNNLTSLTPQQKKDLEKACKDFESFFIYYLLKVMDNTIDRKDSLWGDSRPMQFYREMFYENLANNLAKVGLGLSDILYKQ
ncbi:MAG: rod-binding protein [Candidatus Omnitrophica bacterium]|nr:rod-binding protein [Candidatus Omnitrophota bacterium]